MIKIKKNRDQIDEKQKNQTITANLTKNLSIFKKLYTHPINSDLSIRTFSIPGINQPAALLSIPSIVDKETIDESILNPLLMNKDETLDVQSYITTLEITSETIVQQITEKVNNGHVALFIDEEKVAYVINCAFFEHRSIESSENEIVLKGPKETFVESAEVNFSLIRKNIRNENLIFEKLQVSKRGKDDVYIGYIKNLTNEDLLTEVKHRIQQINIDTIQNLSILEQHIEDNMGSIFPSILYTERPDRSTTFLMRGGIILLMDNSSNSLIVPITFWDLFQSAEDDYLRLVNGRFIRFIRIFSIFITLLISAIYISVTTFHPEMIPAELLLAIANAKEKVPFTPIIEILLMELAFELIREAGLRVPLAIGPTIGIVGALILGQAAVEANIVSPIVVIIVALSALSSFVIGDIGLNFAIRFARFLFIIGAFLFGFYGMVAVLMIGLFYLVSITSFGIPYFLPITPSYVAPNQNAVNRKRVTDYILRPGYLKPKDNTKQ